MRYNKFLILLISVVSHNLLASEHPERIRQVIAKCMETARALPQQPASHEAYGTRYTLTMSDNHGCQSIMFEAAQAVLSKELPLRKKITQGLGWSIYYSHPKLILWVHNSRRYDPEILTDALNRVMHDVCTGWKRADSCDMRSVVFFKDGAKSLEKKYGSLHFRFDDGEATLLRYILWFHNISDKATVYDAQYSRHQFERSGKCLYPLSVHMQEKDAEAVSFQTLRLDAAFCYGTLADLIGHHDPYFAPQTEDGIECCYQ